MEFSYKTRKESIKKMQEITLDLLIIGGGITGAGVAIQAAASGLETGLIEMQDFSQGTSSRSTKLVHGGIRYLKNFIVEVVSDTVSERAIVQQIAPHIPKPETMLLPIYSEKGATFNMFKVKLAMDLYDLLAGISDTPMANKLLSADEVLRKAPFIKEEGLVGGGEYLDFNNSDVRLVIENIKRAHEDGALIASRVKAEGFTYDENGKINGVIARDLIEDEEFVIKSRLVINTSGPWSDDTRNLAEGKNFKKMRPTKGVHLVVDREKLPVNQPIYSDSGFSDGRMIFVIPRENKTYFGTTDTDYAGDLTSPKVSAEDVEYLLKSINYRYPDANLTIDDIESSWAGIRPLLAENQSSDYNGGDSGRLTDDSFGHIVETVAGYLNNQKTREEVERAVSNAESSLGEQKLDPSQVSRGSSLERDDNGLITLAGGKITDYRKMAEGAMRLVCKVLSEEYGRNFRLINSKTYPVSGGDLNPSYLEEEIKIYARLGVNRGLKKEDAFYLANLYGSNAPKVYSGMDIMPEDCELHIRDALSLFYALNYEMALTPTDYFLRRTNIMLFMRDKLDEMVAPVLVNMQRYFNWTDEECNHHKNDLEEAIYLNDLAYLK